MSDRWAIVPIDRRERRELIAAWLAWRWREVAREEGVRVAAARLRRYGIPIEIALRVLGIEPTTVPAPRQRARALSEPRLG